MRWLRSPRQRWWLLAVLWLLLLILGIGGFIQQARDLGTSTSPLDNLYFTLQLAALDYKGSSSEINWRLQIARFVAPIIAATTIIQSASVVFREQFARFRAGRARRHTVVCGLGPVGTRLVGALSAEGRAVVAVEADPASPGIAAVTDLGVPVIIGDPTDVATLAAASVGRASQLVAITESDAVNAAIAAAVARVGRRAGMPPIRCAVHLTNADLAHLVRSTELGRSDQRHVEFFNLHERAAAALLSEHVVGEDSEFLHLVVMGVGQFGRNIILAAARRHAGSGSSPLHITLVDRVATARFHALLMQHPALASEVEIVCIDLDLEAPTAEAVEQFDAAMRSSPPQLVVVAFDDESRAWSVGLFVRNRLAVDVPVVLRTESDGGLTGLLEERAKRSAQVAGGAEPRLVTFPFLDRVCSVELIEGGVREQLARSLHEDYLARHGHGDGLRRDWAALSDDERESSRSAADAIVEQLASVGCGVVPLRRWGSSDAVFTPAECNRLAQREHERWRAEREAGGWKAGERRDDDKRINPLLVPWHELSDEDREENRAAIRALPTLLARAGFEIARPEEAPTSEGH